MSSSKIIGHKFTGTEVMYLLEEKKLSKRRTTRWRSIKDLGNMLREIVDYEVDRKEKLLGKQQQKTRNLRFESEQDSKQEISSKKNMRKLQKSRSMKKYRKDFSSNSSNSSGSQSCQSEQNQKSSGFSNIKTRLRGPAIEQISKMQFQASSSNLTSKVISLSVRSKKNEGKRPVNVKPQIVRKCSAKKSKNKIVQNKGTQKEREINKIEQTNKNTIGNKEILHYSFLFTENSINYYGVFFKDKSNEVLSTDEMMKKYPQLLVLILQKLI